MPTALIAIGGNALLSNPYDGSLDGQYQTIMATATKIVNLIKAGINVIITHGNGPQVGFALYRSQIAQDKVPVLPFHYAVADTQGVIGYMFLNALDNELHRAGLDKKVVSLVTRTLVDKKDPAFLHEDKPIGPYLDEKLLSFYKSKFNWSFIQDTHGMRRAVASPQPLEILEVPSIKKLNEDGFLVVCTGGGGVPVVKDEHDNYQGIGAVIDKDRSSALLASILKVDYFVIPTSVNKVCLNFGKANEKSLDKVHKDEALAYLKDGHFAKGSMGPKIEAIVSYLDKVDGVGIISSITSFDEAILHQTGSIFVR